MRAKNREISFISEKPELQANTWIITLELEIIAAILMLLVFYYYLSSKYLVQII